VENHSPTIFDASRRSSTSWVRRQSGCRCERRFDVSTAVEYAKALEPYGLFWYEEAGDPLDFQLQAELANHYSQPMATGENLFSMQDARNLIRYGGMRSDRDWLQFDCALSYGLVEYMRTLEMLKEHGWSSGAAYPWRPSDVAQHRGRTRLRRQRILSGRVSAFWRFRRRHACGDSYVRMPDVPGVGFEAKSALYRVMKSLAS
jgi:L-alanine-DL-glutamate epimerase-like enolase superfamily enzyme